MDEATKDRLREQLEDAVVRALEAGMPKADVEEEVRYTLENYEEDQD